MPCDHYFARRPYQKNYMKKKLYLAMLAGIVTTMAHAQFNFSGTKVDVGANYAMYKGDFQKSTPGGKLRVSVPYGGKTALGLAFTYGVPVKVPSMMSFYSGSVPSEIVYNFKTITLDVDYFFGGEKEEGFSFNANAGAGLVLVGYKEKLKGTAPSGEEPLNQVEPGSENGFTINLGLGTQYAMGRMIPFVNAGVAIPANKVNEQYVVNVIPLHFMLNAGIRIALGQGSDD